ncbi:hypothetical protein AOQ84DRAFT_355875 [Glonium stellatum]|uniref:ASCH domain-containing protein n=1 Tax=Glonium stellatum TaxID=574774 RepID=A0A8E2EWK7_9PEZI|nr:hypothetical protein AOQ84DRAFT_355875 [Glonium stellatum]
MSKVDVFMSIKPEYMGDIVLGTKNHEYRKYLLPASVERIWFYTSSPAQELRYIAAISKGKASGEVPEDGGLGNKEFNEGKEGSAYAYEILQLWELGEPMSLEVLKRDGYLKGPPQKYNWVSQGLLSDVKLDGQKLVFTKKSI